MNSELITDAFDQLPNLTPTNELRKAVHNTLEMLNQGTLRIAEPSKNGWQINTWAKKAILLSFRLNPNQVIPIGGVSYYDKIPLKYADYTEDDFKKQGARIVPQATVRHGCFIGNNAILMPCYVNIGAYIDEDTLIDTWATVGSCAQIGKRVHLSGGAGIGGVLEPLQAHPTIIEDDCFIGARSEIVEGVIVEKGSVIAMGVFISQSTPIYDRQTKKIHYGRVPAGSVVIPGSLPSVDGLYSRAAAIIVKTVDEKTRSKTSINDILRENN
jgi:2,3,4,5-tetrahydropyridine-2-carboxylate N-succinyltransferase